MACFSGTLKKVTWPVHTVEYTGQSILSRYQKTAMFTYMKCCFDIISMYLRYNFNLHIFKYKKKIIIQIKDFPFNIFRVFIVVRYILVYGDGTFRLWFYYDSKLFFTAVSIIFTTKIHFFSAEDVKIEIKKLLGSILLLVFPTLPP